MGDQIHFFVSNLSDVDRPKTLEWDTQVHYSCKTQFEFSKWLYWAFDETQPTKMWIGVHAAPTKIDAIPVPVGTKIRACWINKEDTYDWCHEDDYMFRITTAGQLTGIKLYEDKWHESVIVHAKMAMAALASLPFDWPVIIYIV